MQVCVVIGGSDASVCRPSATRSIDTIEKSTLLNFTQTATAYKEIVQTSIHTHPANLTRSPRSRVGTSLDGQIVCFVQFCQSVAEYAKCDLPLTSFRLRSWQ